MWVVYNGNVLIKAASNISLLYWCLAINSSVNSSSCQRHWGFHKVNPFAVLAAFISNAIQLGQGYMAVGPTPLLPFSFWPCFVYPWLPSYKGFPHMEARVLGRTDMHSNLALTWTWDAAKVTSELGLIYSFSVQAQSLLAFLWFFVLILFFSFFHRFPASLRHFAKMFPVYSLSLVVTYANTLFVQLFGLDCSLPFDTRQDIDGFFLLYVWVQELFFHVDSSESRSAFSRVNHTLHNDHTCLFGEFLHDWKMCAFLSS